MLVSKEAALKQKMDQPRRTEAFCFRLRRAKAIRIAKWRFLCGENCTVIVQRWVDPSTTPLTTSSKPVRNFLQRLFHASKHDGNKQLLACYRLSHITSLACTAHSPYL